MGMQFYTQIKTVTAAWPDWGAQQAQAKAKVTTSMPIMDTKK